MRIGAPRSGRDSTLLATCRPEIAPQKVQVLGFLLALQEVEVFNQLQVFLGEMNGLWSAAVPVGPPGLRPSRQTQRERHAPFPIPQRRRRSRIRLRALPGVP